MTSIDKYFKNPAALPTMPELATRLLRSVERDDLSLGEITGLIGRDASLSAKVLRLANSVRYSPSQTVASLRDASMLIGLRGLRELALAAAMTGLFPRDARFDRERFWRHGVATAGYARTLAPACGLDPDIAYLGGLVLRTGRILMLLQEPAQVARTEQLALEPDSLLAQERLALGCTHAEVSAALGQRWKFPALLVQALAAAADPAAAQPFSPLGALLRMASTLADAGERQLPELPTLQALHGPLMQRLNLDLAAIDHEALSFDVLTVGVDQLLA